MVINWITISGSKYYLIIWIGILIIKLQNINFEEQIGNSRIRRMGTTAVHLSAEVHLLVIR